MKRSRRAALAMLCGSGSLLAVDTLGYSASRVRRDATVSVASDADGYLGLTAEGIEDGGLLFGGEDVHRAPQTFDVYNQLPEPIAVTLESSAFALDPVEDGRLVTDDPENLLEPGEAVGDVSVGLAGGTAAGRNGSAVEGAVTIVAEGESTTVEAERDLTLASSAFGASVEVCRGRSHNCVTLSSEFGWTRGALDAAVTVHPPSADPTTVSDRLEPGATRTFEHDVDPYGSSRAGNWTVTSTTPAPENPASIGMPGRPIRIELDDVTVVVDPDATGPNGVVSTTVSVAE